MRHYAILRILLAGFLLYIGWPEIAEATTQSAILFWGLWLAFFVLVVGANFATLLKMTTPPVMEQDYEQKRERSLN